VRTGSGSDGSENLSLLGPEYAGGGAVGGGGGGTISLVAASESWYSFGPPGLITGREAAVTAPPFLLPLSQNEAGESGGTVPVVVAFLLGRTRAKAAPTARAIRARKQRTRVKAAFLRRVVPSPSSPPPSFSGRNNPAPSFSDIHENEPAAATSPRLLFLLRKKSAASPQRSTKTHTPIHMRPVNRCVSSERTYVDTSESTTESETEDDGFEEEARLLEETPSDETSSLIVPLDRSIELGDAIGSDTCAFLRKHRKKALIVLTNKTAANVIKKPTVGGK
jgi:hypothetical protein